MYNVAVHVQKQMNAHTKVEWGLQSRAGWPSRQGCRPAGEGQSDRILHSFMTQTHREKIADSSANATQQPQLLLTVDYTCPGGKVRANTLNCAVFRRYSVSISHRFRLFSPEYRLNACNLANRRTRNGEKAKRQY